MSLTRAILVAAPSKPPAPVKQRLNRVYAAGITLQTAWIAVNRPNEPRVSLRVFDVRHDRGWRSLTERIAHWEGVEHPKYANQVERAGELQALLFPTGVDFLKLKYHEQWAESEWRFELIEKDKLEPELVALVGEAFMTELRQAHAEYGEALNITTKRSPATDPARVIDALRGSRKALSNYARLLFALTDEDDEAAVTATEAQLEPIFRFRVARSGAAAETDEPAELALPELPALAPTEPADEA